MTTIVYKDGILAADTLMTEGNYYLCTTEKIHNLDNIVVGAGGDCALIEEFIKFLKGEAFDKELFRDKDRDLDAIVVNKKTGEVTLYENSLVALRNVKAEFFAIGSGKKIAIGALAMGATPKQAIEIASRFDLMTNNQVTEVEVIKRESIFPGAHIVTKWGDHNMARMDLSQSTTTS